MIISFCIPCKNRTEDLLRILPLLQSVCEKCPPAEVVVVDYNSDEPIVLPESRFVHLYRYEGRKHYHMAHARNLSILACSGEYAVITSSDIYFDERFLPAVRAQIEAGCVWMRDNEYRGVVTIRVKEFIHAGGFDERFEFYGPEDRDLDARLVRRGSTFGLLSNGMIHVIPTPDAKKVRNYRLPISKHEMSRRMRAVFDENEEDKILIANVGVRWGAWS